MYDELIIKKPLVLYKIKEYPILTCDNCIKIKFNILNNNFIRLLDKERRKIKKYNLCEENGFDNDLINYELIKLNLSIKELLSKRDVI